MGEFGRVVILMAPLVTMRVLICSQSHGSTLPAATVGAALREGWLAERPADELDLRPLGGGGAGFLAAVFSSGLAEPTLITSTVSSPEPIPVTAGRSADEKTWWLETSDAALGEEPTPHSPPDFTRSSATAGHLLGQIVRAGARRVIIGVGGARKYDGGIGFLAGLAAALDIHLPDDDAHHNGVAHFRTAAPDLSWLGELRQKLADIELVGACDVEAPLLGMSGVGAGYATAEKIAPEHGAQLNTDLTRWAAAAYEAAAQQEVAKHPSTHLEISGRKLLPLADGRVGGAQRPGMAPFTGAGGGVGFALRLLGGQSQDGAGVMVSELNIAEAAEGYDLVLATVADLEWRALASGALVVLGEVVTPSLTPLIAVAQEVQVGRREWARVGLSATYEFPGIAGGAVVEQENALRNAGARLALTWSR